MQCAPVGLVDVHAGSCGASNRRLPPEYRSLRQPPRHRHPYPASQPRGAGFGTRSLIMQCAPSASRRARLPPRWIRLGQLSTTVACLPEPAIAAEAPAPSSNQPAWPCAAGFGTRQPSMQRAPAAPRRASRGQRWVRGGRGSRSRWSLGPRTSLGLVSSAEVPVVDGNCFVIGLLRPGIQKGCADGRTLCGRVIPQIHRLY
jgi:hypothetical protein